MSFLGKDMTSVSRLELWYELPTNPRVQISIFAFIWAFVADS